MTTAQVPGSLQRHPLEIAQGVSRWLERRPYVAAALLAVALLLAYWWQREFMPGRMRSLWGPYFVAMLGWVAAGGLGVYLYRLVPRAETGAQVERGQVLFVAGVVGVFIVSLEVVTGMLANFGNSPYAHSPRWLLINLFFAGSTLAAIEISRATLLNALGRKSLPLALLVTSLGLAALQYGPAQYTGGTFTAHAEFWGAEFIPAVSLGLLAGFFALYGGVFAGLLIAGPIVAFTFYSPILPVADWPIMALVGVAGPAMGLWIADGLFSPTEEAEADEEPRRGLARYVSLPSVAWILTALMGLSLFWFSFGFFGYMPSFVPSHSMEPNIQQGDVVLTGPVDPAEIEVGDVVLYEMVNGQRVLHRVIEIETTDAGERRFILQGDSNNTPDLHPVEPDQVMGQYLGRVPKVGWLPIKFNELVLDKVR